MNITRAAEARSQAVSPALTWCTVHPPFCVFGRRRERAPQSTFAGPGVQEPRPSTSTRRVHLGDATGGEGHPNRGLELSSPQVVVTGRQRREDGGEHPPVSGSSPVD